MSEKTSRTPSEKVVYDSGVELAYKANKAFDKKRKAESELGDLVMTSQKYQAPVHSEVLDGVRKKIISADESFRTYSNAVGNLIGPEATVRNKSKSGEVSMIEQTSKDIDKVWGAFKVQESGRDFIPTATPNVSFKSELKGPDGKISSQTVSLGGIFRVGGNKGVLLTTLDTEGPKRYWGIEVMKDAPIYGEEGNSTKLSGTTWLYEFKQEIVEAAIQENNGWLGDLADDSPSGNVAEHDMFISSGALDDYGEFDTDRDFAGNPIELTNYLQLVAARLSIQDNTSGKPRANV